MSSRLRVSSSVQYAIWAAALTSALAPAATTTTTLSSTGSNPYSLTATVTTTGLPPIAGSVTFTDQTNQYTLNTTSLSTPIVTQSFLQPVRLLEGQACTGSAQSGFVCPFFSAVLAADFNGDGKPDLALSNGVNVSVTVMLGSGDGTFPQRVTSPTGVPLPRLVARDFNNDGKLDLLSLNSDASAIIVLFGNGDGSFSAQASTPTAGQVQPDQIAVADLNSDGKLDLAIRPSLVGDPLRVYLGRGDGTFLPPLPYAVVPVPIMTSLGDFNGDRKPDIAYIVNNVFGTSGMYVGLGRGDGTFEPASWYQFIDDSDPEFVRTYVPQAKVQGDFNGDGKTDLAIVASSRLFVMLGNGDGTFRRVGFGTSYPFASLGALLPADFNGDSKLDVLLTNGIGNAWSLLLGNGDGTLQAGSFNLESLGAGSAAVDLNGDGAPDVVGSSVEAPNQVAVVTLNRLLQTATATLSNATIVGSGLHDVTATYTGDPFHAQSTSAPLPLAAMRVTTNLQLVASANSIPFRGTVNLTATLNPKSAQNLTAGGLVTFSVTGSPAPLGTAALNAQGVATLPNLSLPLGANSITAQYAGDANFAGASSPPVSVTVNPTGAAPANGLSCNGAYTGTFNGNILVLPGQHCEFIGGNVRGNLSSVGGVVVLRNTGVNGNVQILGPAAIRGPAQHAICGSAIQGNLEVVGAFDPVVIGGTAPACGPSTVSGNLKLQLNARQASLQVVNTSVGGNLDAQLNAGELVLSQNTVSRNLDVQTNRGGVTVTGNRVGRNMDVERNAPTTVVTSNQLTGNLQCSSNTGISGSGNTARQKQGQCAAF